MDDNAQTLSLNAKSGAAEVRRAKGHRIREQHDTPRPGLREKPKLTDAMEDEEVAMIPAYKALLDEVRAAIDAEDRKRLIKVVQQMQDSDEWPDGIPASLNMAAVEALRWFGASVAPELVGYLGSSDPDVVESATAAMMDVLSDISLSDRERIDAMLSCLIDMRNSVKGDTAIAILTDGSDQSKGALLDEMEFYFDEGVQTVDDIKKWMAENTDDPDDDDFYAGSKE